MERRSIWARPVFLPLVGCILIGCTEDPGWVEVRFGWNVPPERRPEAGDVWIHARVIFPPGDQRSSEPSRYAPDAQVLIERIPNGIDRQVIVELRETASSTSAVRFYGSSPPFVVAPGSRRSIEVPLGLAEGPSISDAEIVFPEELGFVRTSTIALRVGLARADVLEVAQNSAFTVGVSEYVEDSFEVIRALPDGIEVRVVYELEPDRNCAGGACDGSRAVYLRVRQQGGATDTYPFPLAFELDTRPPAVLSFSATPLAPPGSPLIAPKALGLGGRARARLRTDEILSALSAPIVSASSGASGFPFASTSSGLTEIELELLATSDLADGDYTVSILLTDRAGNRSLTHIDDALRVLTSDPVLDVTQDSVSYLRVPDGYGSDVSLGEYVLPAGPCTR
ncbi:MAG: hypothetical protein HC923_08480 [Myxococcales bacterium]|nr:hypothetical protein [Myxococcales bacterium]